MRAVRGNGAIAQEIAGADVGRAAVEIVGVHRGKGAVDGGFLGKYGGNGAARNFRPDRLVSQHNLQTWPMPRRDALDAVGALLADDQHGPLEAGTAGVMKPVIDEGFAARADGFELFGAAEARAHASRHYDDSQRHAEILPNWNDGSAAAGGRPG